LNAPKKPGTDLAALKARLAKKSKDAEDAAAPPPPAAQVEHIPAPGEVASHAPAIAYDPPEQYGAPPAPFAPVDVPPPGQVSQPASYSAPAAAPAADDPFGGPQMYEPTPSYTDTGGDVPGRSSLGPVLFASAIFLAVGLGAGWIGHKIVSGREKLEAAKAKGAEMVTEVQKVADVRKGVSLKLEELSKTVVADPTAGSNAIIALLQESFDKFPRVENLYGWQLGGIHPTGVKKTFELYEKSTRLRVELAALAGFLNENAAALKGAGGPVSFGVKFTDKGATMVELVAPMCGESLENLAALQPCEDVGKALAFKIRETIGGTEKVLPKGTAPEQVMFLQPEGPVFTYAVGLEPAKNAQKVRDFMMSRVAEALAEMSQAETTTLKAMQAYSDNPDVDGSNPQPEP
jgi:hypothetical protein